MPTRDRRDRFLQNGDQSGSRSYDIFSPKVGVLWDVDAVRGRCSRNVSRSAEVPSFGENTFATPASSTVDAQTATTYEIGTRGRRPDFTWDVALYRAEIQQRVAMPHRARDARRLHGRRTRTARCIRASRRASASRSSRRCSPPEDRFWFNVAYTYNDFFFDGDARYGNNRLPGAPPHYIRAELLYKHPGGFYAGPNIEWVPQAYFADNANSVTVDPYALLNFKVGYDRGTGWSGYLEGRNLLDARYIASTSIAETANAASALFEPGTGRAIYGGMRYRM